jgi:hypothetical protein
MTPPPWLARLLALLEQGAPLGVFRTGDAVFAKHEPWCEAAMAADRETPCRCEPTLEFRSDQFHQGDVP